MEQFYPRQFYWERGKGATLPLPGLKLGSLRSPRFLLSPIFFLPLISLTAELDPRLKDLEPKLNTEKLKGVKIGKTEKCGRMVL